jgi:hypothetical protein
VDDRDVAGVGRKPLFYVGGDKEGLVEGQVRVGGVAGITHLVAEWLWIVFVLAHVPNHKAAPESRLYFRKDLSA